ncbi:MAG TPA: hypothetical protein DC054_11995 [Blastocatellia bacterium]|nr:hypothetical protein [Blastocatellia bacterium]
MKQHYVPKTFLRSFQDPKKPSFVWVYRRRQEPIQINIINIAKEHNLYTFAEPGGQPTLEVETALARLEGAVTPLLRRINKSESGIELTREEKYVLALFSAYQYVRTPAMQRGHREKAILMMRDVAAELGATFTDPPPKDERPYSGLQKASMLEALSRAPEIALELMVRRVEILRSRDVPFITSDVPATTVGAPPGFTGPEFFEIFMPVGPKAAILFCQDSRVPILEAKINAGCRFVRPDNARTINRTTVSIAERFLFASYRDEGVRNLFDKTDRPTRASVEEFEILMS